MPKYVVRYGSTRILGIFSVRGGDQYRRGEQVIARTTRGLEVGEVLAVADAESMEQLSQAGRGQILRGMSVEDLGEWAHIQTTTRDEFEACQRHVDKLGLDMQLVDLEHLFGGERIIVYYLSEERVDFRELVRKLAGEFQTRIEMRQIGVRDEAKLLADYGDCGKPVCCNTHLSSMPPVSMKMAKLQKATLDPNKISGRCGRLKCCLRYEYDTYVDMQAELPPSGSDIVTREGRGRVVSQSILAQQLMVEMEDHRRILVHVDDVLTILQRGSGRSRKKSGSRTQDRRPSRESSESGDRSSSGKSGRKPDTHKGTKRRERGREDHKGEADAGPGNDEQQSDKTQPKRNTPRKRRPRRRGDDQSDES